MGSIEYILNNIAHIDDSTLDILRGEGFKAKLLKRYLSGNVMGFIDSLLQIDNASVAHLGSSELTPEQTGSLDAFFGLSSKSETPAQ